MAQHEYYVHAPGFPSRWGVVDVGLKCTHSCKFCYYSYLDDSGDQFRGMRHAQFHSMDHLRRVIAGLADNGFLGFDVTGGEPTLHPNIVELIAYATELGLSSRIITLGQWLMRPMKNTGNKILLDALLDAGLTNFLFSHHASDPDLFRQMTGEEFGRLSSAMDELDKRGFQYTTNTTIVEDNYRLLPEIATSITNRNTYLHNFIFMNAYYAWSRKVKATSLQADYQKVTPYLRKAVDILESAGIPVNIRYAPLCSVAGMEKNLVGVVGVRYDPYEWMNAMDHAADPSAMNEIFSAHHAGRIPIASGQAPPDAMLFGVQGQIGQTPVVAARGNYNSRRISKVFPANCQICSAINVCDGVAARYVEERGGGEFIPYVGESRGDVLDKDRQNYLPAFFVKRSQNADMKAAIARILQPKPVSSNPKVSVVITSYNYGKFLTECIDSVLAQTWKNIEVIVIDDASTDNTEAITRSYKNVLYFRLSENSGQPAHSRNYGISHSTGSIIMCLDADDKIAPTYIEESIEIFKKNPAVSIVYPATQCFGDRIDFFSPPNYKFSDILMINGLICASLWRREMWDAVGGYKANFRGCEDWGLWIEAGGMGFFGVRLPRTLFYYRVHADGIYQQDVEPNKEQKYRNIILENSDLYPPRMLKQAKMGEQIERSIE